MGWAFDLCMVLSPSPVFNEVWRVLELFGWVVGGDGEFEEVALFV